MKYAVISSVANPLIKEAVKIRKKPVRQAFFIEGEHLIETALASPDVEFKRVFFTHKVISGKEGRRLLGRIAQKTGAADTIIEVSAGMLSKLADTETPQGIAAVVSHSTIKLKEINFRDVPFLIICDGIRDPGNLGTVIRVSDAAGADAVITLPGTCSAFNAKAVRATSGSLFNIPVICPGYDELEGFLGDNGIELYLADTRAEKSLYECNLRKPAAIAFGNEAHGASKSLLEMAAGLIKIPLIGRAESLNVAAAASICLYETARQRRFFS